MSSLQLDLDLLVLLEAITQERSITRAAQRLGITQPTASKGLDRLRYIFNDQLFIRTSRGMQPTSRTLELSEAVGHALMAVRKLTEKASPFNPREAKGVLRIAMSDVAEFVLLPALVARLAKEAPGLSLQARPLDKENAFELLETARLDCIVGIFGKIPSRFGSTTLWEERFLCVASKSRVRAKARMSLDDYANAPHILVSLRDDSRGFVDEVLEKQGRSRRIVATVGRFMVVPYVLQKADCIATLPSRMAREVTKSAGCTVFEPPFEMKPWKESLIWHKAKEESPMQVWFRGLVQSCSPKDKLQ